MSFTKKLILGSFVWKLLEKCSVQLITFIVTIILARILLPEEYGVVAILTIFINLANVIIDGGLNTALIQKKDSDDLDFSTIFFSSSLISIIIYFLLYLLAPFIAYFYQDETLVSLTRVLSITVIPCAINAVQKAYISKFMLFKKMFYCSLISILISGVISIYYAYNGVGAWALVIQILVNQFSITVIMFFMIGWKPKLIFSWERFAILFDYGWKIFVTNFIIALYEDIRGLLIGKYYKPEILAYFDRGKQFPSLIMGNINSSIQTVLFPAFSDSQDDRDKVKAMMRKSTQISCFFVLPLLMGVAASSHSIVLMLLGTKWLPCVPYVIIFSFALMLMPIQSSNMLAIKSLGYSNIILKLEVIKKIVEAIILIVSFQFDVYVVAWGIFFYNFICIFINLYPNKKLLNYSIPEQLKDVFLYYSNSLIMGLFVYWVGLLHLNSVVLFFMQLISGVAIYYILCKFTKVDTLSYVMNTILKSKK